MSLWIAFYNLKEINILEKKKKKILYFGSGFSPILYPSFLIDNISFGLRFTI